VKHDQTTRESQELSALYALGALSQQEAQALDAHLREGCPVCDAELKQFEQVVGVLGSTAEAVVPPAYLRDLLSVRIQREASEAPTRQASVIQFPEQAGVILRTQAPAWSASGRALLPWAIAAVLLIALASTFTAWRMERRDLKAAIDENRESASAALDANSEIKEQLRKERATATELAQINSVLSSPQSRIIPLAGQDPAPDSAGKIYWDVRGQRWVVTADLPPAPAGKVYQLWFVTPESKISAGLISPDDIGHGFTIVRVPPNVGHLAAAAITLEPEGGSQQPTMPIYLLGKTS